MNDSEKKLNLWEQSQNDLMLPEEVNWDKYLHAGDKGAVRTASDCRDDYVAFTLADDIKSGHSLPWLDAEGFRFRPSEVTIHGGLRGHRKSLTTGQLALGLVAQNVKTLSISLEMNANLTLQRMCRQFNACSEPSLDQIDRMFSFLSDRMYFYDQLGTVSYKRIISVCRYAIIELGVQNIWIDSLLKLGIPKTDLDLQAKLMDELTALSSDTGAHINLVAHSNKPKSDTGRNTTCPDIDSISGSSDITNHAANVIIHFASKDATASYDQLLNVDKQRNPAGTGDPEFSLALGFCEKSLQMQRMNQRIEASDWEAARWR